MNITLHFFIFPVDVDFSQPLSALLDNQGLDGWEYNLYYPSVFMDFTHNFWNQLLPRPWIEKQQGNSSPRTQMCQILSSYLCSVLPHLCFHCQCPAGYFTNFIGAMTVIDVPLVMALGSKPWHVTLLLPQQPPKQTQAMSESPSMIYPRPWITYRYFLLVLAPSSFSETHFRKRKFPEYWIAWRHNDTFTTIKKFQNICSTLWSS